MTTALIVEDDSVVAAFLRYVLDGEGVASVCYLRGDAVDYEAGYDLALVDLVLPDVSGLWIAERLRDADPHIPIVFVTGSTDPHNVRLMLGYTSYIVTKPFTEAKVSDLRRVVQSIKTERH